MGKKKSKRKRSAATAAATAIPDPETLAVELPARFDAAVPREDGTYEIPRAALVNIGPVVFGPAGVGNRNGEDEADTRSEGQQSKSFRGVVNSGGVIPNHWFWGNFAIDMEGLEIPTQEQPVLRDHDTSKILGMTELIEVTKEKRLEAEGRLLGVTQDGGEVLALAAEGFPFQMSCYVPPSQILFVDEGEEVEVNGHKLKGPGHIFKKSKLLEVTVTPLGADSNTSLALLSRDSSNAERDTLSLSVSRLSKPNEEDEMAEEHDPTPEVESRTLTQADAEQMAQAAVTAERERLTAIDELAADTGVPAEFVAELKNTGVSADAAGVAILKKVKELKPQLLAQLETESPETNNDPEVEFTEVAPSEPLSGGVTTLSVTQLEAMDNGEDRFKAEWLADYKGCQNEFSEEDVYVAARQFETQTLVPEGTTYEVRV